MEKLISGAKELGLELSPRQIEQFNIYYQELVGWNRRLNLTAITGYEEVQVKHFLDSLSITLALKPPLDSGFSAIDVGTGAGMPGIPLKILLPGIRLVLLEATAKKAAFLEDIRQKLGLESTEIVVGRAEEVAHISRYRESFGLVLSRAVAPLPTLVELTLPFAAVGGSLVAQKKGAIDLELSRAARAIKLLGGSLHQVREIDLEGLDDERYLVIIDKVSTAPETYPRRPGMPAKRPLT